LCDRFFKADYFGFDFIVGQVFFFDQIFRLIDDDGFTDGNSGRSRNSVQDLLRKVSSILVKFVSE